MSACPEEAPWRKSSYSTNGGNCVEVAPLKDGRIAIRDSKDPSGPVLVFDRKAFSRFTESIRGDHYTL